MRYIKGLNYYTTKLRSRSNMSKVTGFLLSLQDEIKFSEHQNGKEMLSYTLAVPSYKTIYDSSKTMLASI